jgi:hypothetical protein
LIHPGLRTERQGSRGPLAIRHSLKNRYLMIVRNDRPADAFRCAGAILVTEVLRFVNYGLSRPAALTGYVQILRGLPHALATRRQIQRHRLIDGPALRRWLEPYPFRRELRRRLRRRRLADAPPV